MRSHYVLNSEVTELNVRVSNFSQLLGVVFSCIFTILLRFGASTNHLARPEDQSRSLWVSNTHDGSRKSLRFILDIATLQTNLIKVKFHT